MSDTQKRPPTPEQAARDMLERIDMPDAQSLSAGDIGDISQAIAESWEVQRLRARVAELEAREAEATALINAAVELMTTEQVGRWTGVRAWLEQVTP